MIRYLAPGLECDLISFLSLSTGVETIGNRSPIQMKGLLQKCMPILRYFLGLHLGAVYSTAHRRRLIADYKPFEWNSRRMLRSTTDTLLYRWFLFLHQLDMANEAITSKYVIVVPMHCGSSRGLLSNIAQMLNHMLCIIIPWVWCQAWFQTCPSGISWVLFGICHWSDDWPRWEVMSHHEQCFGSCTIIYLGLNDVIVKLAGAQLSRQIQSLWRKNRYYLMNFHAFLEHGNSPCSSFAAIRV